MKFAQRASPSLCQILVGLAVWAGTLDVATAQPPARRSFADVTEAQWQRLATQETWNDQDGVPLSILSRLENISAENWQSYLQDSSASDWDAAIANIAQYAGSVFEFSGTVRKVQQIGLGNELRSGFEFDHYFLTLIDADIGDRQTPVVVLSSVVPQPWLAFQRRPDSNRPAGIDTRCRFSGCLLTLGSTLGPGQPVLAAKRIRWLPTEPQASLELDPDHVLLAEFGFDLGLLDDIVQNSRQAFLAEEEPLFRNLMTAVKKIDSQPIPPAGNPLDLIDLLQSPHKYSGNLCDIIGNVRRITPVKIQSAELRNRLGIDHYYHLDVFVSLDNRRLRFVDDPNLPLDQQKEMIIEGTYGITVILMELPAQLIDLGKRIPKIHLPCLFIKQWQHTTTGSQQASPQLRKRTPIFIGLASQALVADPLADSTAMTNGVATFFVLLAGLVVALYLFGQLRRQTSSRIRLQPTEIKFPPPTEPSENDG